MAQGISPFAALNLGANAFNTAQDFGSISEKDGAKLGGAIGLQAGGPFGGAVGGAVGAGVGALDSFVKDTIGFGSGKGEDQQIRDGARNVLENLGVAAKIDGVHNVFLADGTPVSIGGDGGSQFLGADGQTVFSQAYDIDTTHPLHNEAVGLVNPLMHSIFGTEEIPRVGMVTQLANAILKNVGPDDIESLRANALAIYKQANVSPSGLSGFIQEQSNQGAFDQGTVNAFNNAINDLVQTNSGGQAQGGAGQLDGIVQGFNPQGQGQRVTGSALWKPVSESDGNLVMLFPYPAGQVVIRDAQSGQVLDVGRSTGPSNGFADTIRFSRPGGAFQNVIVEDAQGNKIPIGDGNQRFENIQVSGFGGGGIINNSLGGFTPPPVTPAAPVRGFAKGKARLPAPQFKVSQAPAAPVNNQPQAKSVEDFANVLSDISRRNQGG